MKYLPLVSNLVLTKRNAGSGTRLNQCEGMKSDLCYSVHVSPMCFVNDIAAHIGVCSMHSLTFDDFKRWMILVLIYTK
jgi:hypothetical protein